MKPIGGANGDERADPLSDTRTHGATTEAPVRLALTRTEAAESLGVSVDFFDQHIAPGLRIVRIGRRRLIAIDELRRWLRANASLALDVDRLR
jgi:excisionase family DNA binding protein